MEAGMAAVGTAAAARMGGITKRRHSLGAPTSVGLKFLHTPVSALLICAGPKLQIDLDYRSKKGK
jgi:hypothetical protein